MNVKEFDLSYNYMIEVLNVFFCLILVKMKLRTKDNSGGTLAMLKLWRDKKISEIEEEYNRKVQEFDAKISKQDGEVSTIIAKTEELINEGEASFEQVTQLKKDIQIMENQVNKLMQIEQTQIPSENTTAQFDLINTYVQLGHQKILIKEKISCRDQDLYAVESEAPVKGYDGLCPRCHTAHVSFQPNRGYYVSTDSLHEYIKIRKTH